MASTQQDADMKMMYVRGLPFPNAPWFNRKDIEDSMDYKPKDGDSFIASYPKTGTTWMQYIILQIVSKATLFPSFDDVNNGIVPYMEMVGVAVVEALPKPRIFKHHLPYNMVQKNSKSKTFYIYRHPEDTVVSYYHFYQDLYKEITPNFETFVDTFVTGNIAYGSYFQHALSFCKYREDPNMLMVSYETLHANRKEEILRIARFLDEGYYTSLLEHEDILNKIIEHTSFDYMKNNISLSHPNSKKSAEGSGAKDDEKVDFFRKGIVGDGKNTLTTEQQGQVKAAAETVLKGTKIFEEWYPNEK